MQFPDPETYPMSVPKAPATAVAEYQRIRLGMFIHYGLYSILGRREWAMHYERIPFAEYRKLADRFPEAAADLNPREWARQAKAAGMGYACLTTRHHEGFCLWDTDCSDFNSMKTAGRDLVREFVDGCRAEGVRPALYFSVGLWSDDGFVAGPKEDPDGWQRWCDTLHAQMEELMTRYGDIFYVFYDACPPPHLWDAHGLQCKVREWQPNILISDRCQLDADVKSAENRLESAPEKLWECCLTMNGSWGYNYGDPHWKSALEIIHKFAICIHEGGNLLLNVGPRANGSLEPEAIEILEVLGGWVGRHREFLETNVPHPVNYVDRRLSAASGNIYYAALHWYHGPETCIAGIGNRVERVTLLGDGREVSFRQEADRLFLPGLPEEWPDIMPVVKVVLDGPPVAVPHPLDNPSTKYEF